MNKETWEKDFDILALELGLDGEQMDELRDFVRKITIKKKGGDIMNKKTYEALKRIINGTVKNEDIEFEDIEKVVSWIDEVAKEIE